MSDSLQLFKKLRALDRVAHRELRFAPSQPYDFASAQLFAPITLSEGGMVAREYAIVFSNQAGSLPLALLGRAQHRNLYVRLSGHWTARYVPAHIRRYPFVMGQGPLGGAAEGEARASDKVESFILFDTEAPHVGHIKGDRLFDDQGEPTAVLKKVAEVLAAMEQDSVRTLRVINQLESLGLLVERQVNIASKQGRAVGLTGLRVVDFDRFEALEGQVLAELRHSGALELIYAHQMSLTNLQDGVLVQNEPDAPTNSSGSISFEGIDWSKF